VSARLFVLAHPVARRNAVQAVQNAPEGHVVRISEPSKSREQEDCYHAMIGDIAKQYQFMGQRWHKDDMKRLMVDAFAQAMREAGAPLHHDGRVVPSLDGRRIVQLGIQTSDFWKSEASAFIDFLAAWGSENGIEWSNERSEATA